MSLAFAFWLMLVVAFIAYRRGRRRGRHEMAATVEARYGPLLQQLEEFVGSVEAFGDDLSKDVQRHINEGIEAMRRASSWN